MVGGRLLRIFEYVGGYYGNASMTAMMQELMEKGPLVVSFEPNEDFMFYNGGVFYTGIDFFLKRFFSRFYDWIVFIIQIKSP